MTTVSFKKPEPKPVIRPGISAEYLKAAGVRHVNGNEAAMLCGINAAGIWIPFRTISGKPVNRDSDGGRVFGRLRLDKPIRSDS